MWPFRKKQAPSYGLNKLLLVTEGGPWTGEYVMVTGLADEGPTYCRKNCRRAYPVAVFSGADREIANFTQLGTRIHECGLEPVSEEYLQDFQRKYNRLQIFATQNPLWHESELV